MSALNFLTALQTGALPLPMADNPDGLRADVPEAVQHDSPLVLSQGPDMAALTNPLQALSTSSGRPRLSALDVIGKLGDVFAKVGGSDAQYQPNLDAATERQRAIDLDAMRKAQFDMSQRQGTQSLASGDQTLALGKLNLDEAQREPAARLLGSIADSSDPAGLWQSLSDQLGLPAEQQQRIGDLIRKNPAIVGPLARAYGYKPAAQGSQAGAIQIADYLKTNSPELLPAYLKSLSDPKAITPAQQAQIEIARAHLGLAQSQFQEHQYEFDNPHAAAGAAGHGKGASAADTADTLTLLDNIEHGFNDLHGLHALPGDEGGISGVVGAVGRTGIGQMIGEQAGSASAEKRLEVQKNIAGLQQAMIRSLPASATRSRFEQEIVKQALPDPFKMDMGTAQTVIGQLRQKYQSALANLEQEQTGGAAPAAPSRPAARPSGGAPAVRARPGTRSGGRATTTFSNW